jgi:hypothetical protein
MWHKTETTNYVNNIYITVSPYEQTYTTKSVVLISTPPNGYQGAEMAQSV